MLFTILPFFVWLYVSPINWLFGTQFLQFPTPPAIVIDALIYAPLMYRLTKKWLNVMMRRKKGPAAGIDTVEPGKGRPEPGDEWGLATRPYTPQKPDAITGSKSEIRESPFGLDDGFFVKMPDIETGEELFDPEKLKKRAMIRSKVSSGGWINKSVSSRATGSLKASDAAKHGRPIRSRMPSRDIKNIHLPSTVVAAATRAGLQRALPVRIMRDDVRESVFTGRTPLTIILVIDVSLSMKGSMEQVREFIERVEAETRGSKDKTGIIAFKDSGAVEVQVPTTNWNKIYRALGRLKVSGLTPLADALKRAMETMRRERMRNVDVEGLVILISDFSPNIPLAQSVGPGHFEYTPVQDLVRAARLLKKQKVRLACVNVDLEQKRWSSFLKRPYHEALELATLLRGRKEGYVDPIETILAVDEFRRTFGAYLVARAGGGKAYLSKELMSETSIISRILAQGRSKSRLRQEDLKEVDAYLPA
ncbi:VWA domain-containing protein [Candidatus Thorarchaeota archaeon]|nr:MAG: VWA domain-containing protein [Candidatus Thorarchaeota archaeon]